MTRTAGRGHSPADRAGSERVVVVNEALAAKFFPNEDPIGQVLQYRRRRASVSSASSRTRRRRRWSTAGSRALHALSADAVPLHADVDRGATPIRTTSHRWSRPPATYRTGEPAAGSPADDHASEHFRTGGRTGWTGGDARRPVDDLALVLGAVGVYGVISHFVQRRSREYGIRLALGQSPTRMLRHVLTRGAALVALGSAIGIVVAVLARQAAVLDALRRRRRRSDVDGRRGGRPARSSACWRRSCRRAVRA